jgi:superfamily I DNA/RNA helicase
MPERFYLALADLGFKHIFVVADFNQVLYPDRSCNRKQLVDCLAKDRRNVQDANAKKERLLDESAIIHLKYNHRNPGPVARLANYLCHKLDNPQSTCPELRNDMRDAEVPILYGYDLSNPTRNLSSVARRILLTADRDPRKLIGVLCPTIEIRNQYKKELDDALTVVRSRLDYGDVRIDLFDASQQAEPDFTQGGIVILTAQSCKGLEFDIVVIADLDWYRSDSGKVQLLYVMVSRAYERVILLRNLARSCPLDEILPADEDLLKRVM